NPPVGADHPPQPPAYGDGVDQKEDVMTYPAPLRVGAAPAVMELHAVADTLRDCAMQYLSLTPHHWQSPAAGAYRDRLKGLSDAVQAAAGQVDVAIVAAQHHGDQLRHVREALAAGGPMPV